MQQPNINSRINATLNTANSASTNNDKNNIAKMKNLMNNNYLSQVAEVKKNGLDLGYSKEFSVIQQQQYQRGYGNFNNDEVNEEDDDDDGPPGLEDSDEGQKLHDGISGGQRQKQVSRVQNEKEAFFRGQREKENSGGQKDDSVMTGRSGNFGKIENNNASSFNNKTISRQSDTTPSSSGSSGSEIDDGDDSDLSVNDMIRKSKEKDTGIKKTETISNTTPKVQQKYEQSGKISQRDNIQRGKESFVGVVGKVNAKSDKESRQFEGKDTGVSLKDPRVNGVTGNNYQNSNNQLIKQTILRQTEQMGEQMRQREKDNQTNRLNQQNITANLPNLQRISLIETPKLKNTASTHSGSRKSYAESDEEKEENAQQLSKKQWKSEKGNESNTESSRQKEDSSNNCQIRDRRGRDNTGQQGNYENMMEISSNNNIKHKNPQPLMKEEEGGSNKYGLQQGTKQRQELPQSSQAGQQQSNNLIHSSNNSKNQLQHVSSKLPATQDNGLISQRSNTLEAISNKKSSNHEETAHQSNSREASQRTSGDSGQKQLSHTKANFINGFSLEESQQYSSAVSQPEIQSQEIFSYIEKINESIKISNEQMEIVPKLIKAQKALEEGIHELQQNLLKFHKETKILEEQEQQQLSQQQQEGNLNEMVNNRRDYRKLRGKVEVQMKGMLSAKKETLRFMRENIRMIEEQNKTCKICSSMGSTLVDFHHIIQVELGRLKETTKQQSSPSENHRENQKNSNDMSNPVQIEENTEKVSWNNKDPNIYPSIEQLQQQLQEARQIIARLQNEVVISDDYVSRLKSDADEAKEVIRNHLRDIANQKQRLEAQQRNLDVKEREIMIRQRELDQQLLIHQISQNNSPIKQSQEQLFGLQQKKSSQQQFSQLGMSQVSPYSSQQQKSSGALQYKVSEFLDDSPSYLMNSSNRNINKNAYSPTKSKKQNLNNNTNDLDLEKNNGKYGASQPIGYGYSQQQQQQAQQFFRNEEEINDSKYQNNRKYNGKGISQQAQSPFSTKDSNNRSMQFQAKTTELNQQQSGESNGPLEAMKTLIRSIQEEHSSVIDDINSFKN